MDTIATGVEGGYLDYHNMAADTLVKRVMRSADYANRPLVERSMVDFFNNNEQFKSMIADGTITADELKNNVLHQLLEPVLWTQTIEQMVSNGVKEVVELGPGKVLQGLIKRIDRSLQLSGIQ